MHFAEHLRTLIERKLTNCQSASVSKDEYGVSIWCSIFLEETDDCFEAYFRTDSELTSLQKEAIKGADQLFVKKARIVQIQRVWA